MKKMAYIGDIVIIKDKEKVTYEENRVILENGYPYFVTNYGSYTDTFYIEVYGKEILFSNSDLEYLELIEIAERYEFKERDIVQIINIDRISRAEENGFSENINYTVSKIINDEIIISNENKELWLKGGEIRFIKPSKSQDKKIVMVEKSTDNKRQELIDELLDKKDFDKLKELVESNK